MARSSRQRADEAIREHSTEEIRESALSGPPPRALGAFGETFDLIAEVKPRSPSEGAFPVSDPVMVADGYRSGGAAMLSVLTEPTSFGGSLEILRRVSAAADIPVLAKDFLVDACQVYEARDAGADGVLIIARILSEETLAAMIESVEDSGMFALLEAFDGDDIRRITEVASGRDNVLIGVNCRDLDTLDIVPERHEQLAGQLPQGSVAVAESAMIVPEDVARIAGFGYSGALVGSSLMRSEDAPRLIRSMVDAGRRVAVTA